MACCPDPGPLCRPEHKIDMHSIEREDDIPVGFVLEESSISVPPDVAAACEMLGLDPLYVANEGVLAVIVPAEFGRGVRGASLASTRDCGTLSARW